MSGLSLRTGISAGGSYTPMTPASASPSTANAGSIAQAAYGIAGTGGQPVGPATAGLGSVAVGVVAVVALIYLWWTLPR